MKKVVHKYSYLHKNRGATALCGNVFPFLLGPSKDITTDTNAVTCDRCLKIIKERNRVIYNEI